MSSTDAIEDALTRHQVFLQRYSKGREDRLQEFIEDILQEAESRLGVSFAELSTARQDTIIGQLLAKIGELSNYITDEYVDEMVDFLQYELDFGTKVLAANVLAIPKIAPVQSATASMLTTLMQLEPTVGYTIRSALQEFGTRKALEFARIIKEGVLNGLTTPNIVNSLQQMSGIQKRQASTLARTIINHVSVQAREVVMNENKDLIDRYKWVATLDSRTSLICASRDQQIYENIDENPKPPAHFNCRSTITWVIADEFDIGLKVQSKRAAVGAEGTTRVAGDTPYESWLRRQPFSFQAEVLGPTRAILFRDGNLSIGRFVDDSGRTLSLDQLRSLEPIIFQDLGL